MVTFESYIMYTTLKNVDKTMRRTFTLICLVCASVIFSPKNSVAAVTFEAGAVDSRYGDKDMIKVYPNPMLADATIKIYDEIDLQSSKVSVLFYNIVGSEVLRINQIKDYEYKITRDLFKNSGIYFYQLKVDDKVVSTGRLTVK
jgi:hypothetical protein